MRRFLLRAVAFSVPWLLYALAIVLIDPFDRFEIGHVVPESSKAAASPVFNSALWGAVHFERDPGENIMLGSSAMAHLDPSLIKEVSGLDYRNLAVNGGSLIDMVDMFWFADGRHPLKRVCVGLSLSHFNRATDRDFASGAITTARNPLIYLTNRDVLAASTNLVSATYFGGSLRSEAPAMSKDAFWTDQITYGAARNFFEYQFDSEVYAKLVDISTYCRAHGIELKFIILPTHEDIHERIRAFGLEATWKGLGARLSALGETYDFDVDDAVTADRNRFKDPFHFDEGVARDIVRQVFGPPAVGTTGGGPRD